MGLTRQTFRHTAVYSIGNMLSRIIGFVMLPFYANVFEAQGYGVIALIDASLGLLVIAFSGGFQNAIIRIYHEEGAPRGGIVIGTAIAITGALAAAVIVLPWTFSTPLSRILLGNPDYADLLQLSLLSFAIDVVGQSASAYLVIRQQSVIYSGIGLLRLFVALGLNIWLVFGAGMGLKGVFVSTLVASSVSTALFLVVAAHNAKLGIDRKVARKIADYQLPILPGDLIAFVSRQTERYLVRFLIDIRAAGILEMAYKFPPLINMLVTIPFLKAWNTKCIELAETDPAAPVAIGTMFTKFYLTLVFFGVLLAVGVGDVLKILTPADFWPAAAISRVEVLTTIVNGSNSFLLFGLIYRKRTGVISMIRIAGATLKIPLAVFMISTFHLGGAAYTAFIVEFLTCTANLIASQRCFRVQFEYGKVAAITAYGVLVYLATAVAQLPQRLTGDAFGYAIAQGMTWLVQLLSLGSSRGTRLVEVLASRQTYIAELSVNLLVAAALLGVAFIVMYRNPRGILIPRRVKP